MVKHFAEQSSESLLQRLIQFNSDMFSDFLEGILAEILSSASDC